VKSKNPVQVVFSNRKRVFVVSPSGTPKVWNAFEFEKTATGGLVPAKVEIHTTRTARNFFSHYDAKYVPKRLTLV
jgi:hypothetical protein